MNGRSIEVIGLVLERISLVNLNDWPGPWKLLARSIGIILLWAIEMIELVHRYY